MGPSNSRQTIDSLRTLVSNLRNPGRFPHDVDRFDVTETHVSLLLLTGPYVYKFKKPVNPGFLDFSTLQNRLHFCKREVEQNRKLGSPLYLGVVEITGSRTDPEINGSGPTMEYAVKMKQFSPEQRFDRLLERGELSPALIDELADRVARLHENAEPSDEPSEPPLIEDLSDTIDDVLSNVQETASDPVLDEARSWLTSELERLKRPMKRRIRQGRVRKVHGDLHLENIALYDGEPVLYDCIEFDESLRRIDVMNEIAFCSMDLERLDRPDLSWRFVNRYLEHTGDYEGTHLLAFFKTYRALVRAMVTAMKQTGIGSDAKSSSGEPDLASYLDQLQRSMSERNPGIIMLHGFSGSGKTSISQQLLERIGGIRVRSDVERKRLFDVPLREERSPGVDNGIREGIYSEEATKQTYRRLKLLSGQLLNAGYPVFVDATFLKQRRREEFQHLAEEHEVPFVILNVQADESVLRERLHERASKEHSVSDADLEVLEHQLEHHDPLTDRERNHLLTISTDTDVDYSSLTNELQNILSEPEG